MQGNENLKKLHMMQGRPQKEGKPRSSNRPSACRAPAASRAVRCWQLANRLMACPRHSRPQWANFKGTECMAGKQRRGGQQQMARDMRPMPPLTAASGTSSVFGARNLKGSEQE